MATDLTNIDNAVTVVSRINTAIEEQDKGVSTLGANPNAGTAISRVNAAIDAENNGLTPVTDSDNADTFIGRVNALFASIRNGGGGDTPTPTYPDAPSILILGNSFTQDSWSYVPFILKAVGINIKIGMCYTASTGLSGQYNNYNNGPHYSYNYTTGTYTDSTNRGFFYIDTSKHTKWYQKIPKATFNKGEQRINENEDDYRVPTPRQCVAYFEGMESELQSAQAALEDDTLNYENRDKLGKLWDVIVFQQVSSGVSWSNFYDSNGKHYSLKLKEKIDEDIATGHDYVLGWNINHSKGGDTTDVPTDILANIKDACDAYGIDPTIAAEIDVVFPYGTAIFNGRNDSTLKQIGYGGATDLWFSDYQHLTGGLPYYLASLAIVEKIFRKYYPNEGLSVKGNAAINAIIPNSNWVSGKDIPARGAYIAGATSANCLLAQDAAVRACDDMWNIYGGWPLQIKISCTNCYIDSAPSEYGITQGATSAIFYVAKGSAITGIVIKANDGYSLSGSGKAHNWRYTRLGTTTSFSTTSSQCNVSMTSEQVVNNITMYFAAY